MGTVTACVVFTSTALGVERNYEFLDNLDNYNVYRLVAYKMGIEMEDKDAVIFCELCNKEHELFDCWADPE